MNRDRAVADSRYDLAQRLRSDVADRVYARDVRPRRFVGDDVAAGVELELSAKDLGRGLATDADEKTAHLKLSAVRQTDARHSFVRDELGNRTVREKFDIRGLAEGIDVDLRRSERISTVDEVDFRGKTREVKRVVKCRIASADDGDDLVFVK